MATIWRNPRGDEVARNWLFRGSQPASTLFRYPMKRTSGFTLVEVVIALIFAAILLGVAVSAFGAVINRSAASQGLQAFQSLHARARAHAIEGGQNTMLWVDTPGDSVWLTRGGEVLETVRFSQELGVEIRGAPNFFRLCMGPRGYADVDCNSFTTTAKLEFSQGGNALYVEVLPMGQLVY